MENKVILKHFYVLLLSLLISGKAYGGDILIQDGGIERGEIYSVSPNGSNLKKIGDGIFPQWSPDRKYISYIRFGTENTKLVVMSVGEGKEIFNVNQPIDKGVIMYHTWNPKGDGIAFISFGPESSVSYFDSKTKNIRTLHKVELRSSEDALFSTLEWSPDGGRLLFSPSYTSRGKGIYLIDFKKGAVKKLIEGGLFPRFISKERILIAVNSGIWIMDSDGSEKRKIHDAGIPITSVTNEAKGKIIFSAKTKDLPKEPPTRLFLINLENNKVEEIDTHGYMFLTPAISSDGNKIAVIGVKLKNGNIPNGEECYYVYDLKTKEATLLKKARGVKSQEQLGFYILFGGKPIIWR